MTESQWTSFQVQPPKRKRAEAACVACHSKKVKCDLQKRRNQGQDGCSSCAASGNECRTRLSKRMKQHRDVPIHHSVSNVQFDQQEDPDSSREGPVLQQHQFLPGGVSTCEHRQQPDLDSAPRVSQDAHLRSGATATRSPFSSVSQPLRQPAQPQHIDRHAGSYTGISPAETKRTERPSYSAYVVDTGFLTVYGPENEHDANKQATATEKIPVSISSIRPDLLQSFAETYFEFCYTWCPVLDKHDLFTNLNQSPLISDALALVGSHVQPPILAHSTPAEYYERARRRFYDDEESDVLMSLRAISLFYWWAPRPPTMVHRHSSWWWTSVIIRHAQQMGFHREPDPDSIGPDLNLGLRRRLWWTVFARERLTAVCQGKPCIIDPDDCNIKEPSLQDFPPDSDKTKAEVFIYWTRLCAVIGRVAKYLFRSSCSTSTPPSDHPARQLVQWASSLPPYLQLPIGGNRTSNFNRDVHQLYLPYLAVIIVLHLKQSNSSLPSASSTAILAATCIARIFKDILIRGGTRFLMAINCWYCATAFIALSQASRSSNLRADAEEELDILYTTIKELQKMWGTANIFEQGFQRLRSAPHAVECDDFHAGNATNGTNHNSHGEDGDMNWLDYFPFVTADTSPIAKRLLAEEDEVHYFFADFTEDFMNLQYSDLFDSFDFTTHQNHL